MTTQHLYRLGQAATAAAIFVFMPAASCDGGDRNQAGACPADEVCSSETEDGLHFRGPIIAEGFFDYGGVKPLAAGGTQSVSLELSVDGERSPFDLAYTAAIDGTAAMIETKQDNQLRLRGGAPTASPLRITDPIDGTLFDRIDVRTYNVATIGLVRTFGDAFAKTPSDADVLYAPGSDAFIRLAAVDGTVLVDDSMQIAGSGVAQVKWDKVQLGALPPGNHPITVIAAGQTTQLQLPVVAGPDRLESFWSSAEIEVGEFGFICFAAFLGTRYVHVPWTFTAPDADLQSTAIEGCVFAAPRKTGTVGVTAHTGNLTLQHPMLGVPRGKRKPAHSPEPTMATAGDRAALQATSTEE